MQFKFKPFPHIIIIYNNRFKSDGKTFGIFIFLHDKYKNDEALYQHELEHVRQFYNLFKACFKLFNKCESESDAYMRQLDIELETKDINNIDKSFYVNQIKKYCKDRSKASILKDINDKIYKEYIEKSLHN